MARTISAVARFGAGVWRGSVTSLANATLAAPDRMVITVALVSIGSIRLLPLSWFQVLYLSIGRPGDVLLILATIALLSAGFVTRRPMLAAQPTVEFEPTAAASLESHLRLEEDIDKKLVEVVNDTESSALAIIAKVRQLHDTASKLVSYLGGTSTKSGDIGREINESVACVREIGAFVAQLPVRMGRDLRSVHAVVQEINELSGMVEAVQAIGMQSHMLAINAAIEASHAGAAGVTFRIVADEMRKLASNSGEVAANIKLSLGRARLVVEGSMAASINESAKQHADVSLAAGAIQKLLDNFEDMNQYYQNRLESVTLHNEELAGEIGEVLGQIQYQDVVRQCIERIRAVMATRNVCLENALGSADADSIALQDLTKALEKTLLDYRTDEAKHLHSAREVTEGASDLKIELF